MIEVTKEEFYAAMNPRDVHQHIASGWSDKTGYDTEWKTPSGQVIGKSQGPNGWDRTTAKYWLPGKAAAV